MNDELDGLEERVLLLEFKQLKRLAGWTRTQVTAKTTPASAKSVEMRVSRRSGATKYELRSGSGWTVLPADRSTWPAGAKRMQDKIDEFNKQRTVGHRLVATIGGTVKLS
jgi:hypothetical protein